MAKGKKKFAVGTLRVHPRGFGFLVPDEPGEDIFIPKRMTKSAVDGDRVQVEIHQHSYSEKGPEGRVHKILERSRSTVAGTVISEATKKSAAYAYIPLLGDDQLMRLDPSFKGKHGDRVIIEVQNWGSNRKEPLGKVIEKVGHILDPLCDVKAAIAEYEITHLFDPETIEQAKAYGKEVQQQELEGRKDFRNIETFTIDPETAKDFDDALSLSKDKKGYHLCVHIADVSHYVKPGTHLDKAAFTRCNSVYFPGEVVPMLPHELSSHLCSLMPDVERLTITVSITFDFEGNVKNYKIERSVIKSHRRFSYEEAKQVLDGKLSSPHKKTLDLMVELCALLKTKRAERGSIEFALPDISLKLDKNGVPHTIDIVEYDITHQLVEEFMLKANEIVATHLSEQNKPLTYRVHERPNDDNIKDFAALATALGFPLTSKPTAEELQKLFDQARSTAFGKVLATAFIRSMKLASYSTQNIGHYGLGLQYYTHFTSPIRRYIDLVVHRAVLNEIGEEENLEQIALLCSEKERLSAKAENAVTLLKKLRYLYTLAKGRPNGSFKAVITKIQPAGMSFELKECFLEGFIPISGLSHQDYFTFNEKKRLLEGDYSTYGVGDEISVYLEDIDLITLETRWQLSDPTR